MEIQSVTQISLLMTMQPTSGKVSAEDLAVVVQLHLLTQVHEVTLSSWSKFKENQSEIREQKELGDRRHKVQTDQVTGSERRLEGATLHSSRPQRGARLFHDTGYSHPSHRQLNLPV